MRPVARELRTGHGADPLAAAVALDPDADLLDLAAAALAQLLDRAVGDQPAVLDDRHVLAEALDELELVAGEDDRHALGRALGEHAAHHVDAGRVETGERLVEHEHLGVVHERDAELDALLVAERERLHLVAGALGEPEPLDPGVRRRVGVAGREPVQPREVHELVADAHLRVQAALLRHVAEAAARRGVDRPALPEDLARVGLQDAEDDPHRGRLPRPVRADEAEHPARRRAERQVVERKRAAVAAPESDQLEHRSFVYPPQYP